MQQCSRLCFQVSVEERGDLLTGVRDPHVKTGCAQCPAVNVVFLRDLASGKQNSWNDYFNGGSTNEDLPSSDSQEQCSVLKKMI